MDHPESLLQAWANFYVIMGSSAAALTGLMFVVLTLISGSGRVPRSSFATAVFSTPTIVHFGAALLVAAVMSAPWRTFVYPRVLLGITGIYGMAYILQVAFRMSRVADYKPDVEDWVWHTLLPLVSYLLIFLGALLLPMYTLGAPYALAAAVLLMLFIGLHNAWDLVTYLAIEQPEKEQRANAGDAP